MAMTFKLPDLLADWPWPRQVNPHYSDCRLESEAWCRQVGPVSAKHQYALELCDPSLLGAMVLWNASREGCRVLCDVMFIFGAFDDCTDGMDANSVQDWVTFIMDVLRNPHKERSAGEHVFGLFIQSFWLNAIKTVNSTAQQRFVEEFEIYAQSVVDQAEDRAHQTFGDVASFMDNRRKNLGARPSYALLHMDMDIPSEVFLDDSIISLEACVVDMLIIANDIYSFNIEQAQGDDHNLVAMIMMTSPETVDIPAAMDRLSAMHDIVAEKFLSLCSTLPSFGSADVDTMVHAYVDRLGNWVRANDSWSFESWRYFRGKGPEIQKTRLVQLLPRHTVVPFNLAAVGDKVARESAVMSHA